jgi:ligand-binding sensor domain-containing protein
MRDTGVLGRLVEGRQKTGQKLQYSLGAASMSGCHVARSPGFAFLRSVAILTGLQSLTLFALNPQKTLTQYTRTIWTQADGLPYDAVLAMAQTPDGYLWLASVEGLARFDGYEFLVFNKEHGQLPSNSVLSLAAGVSGELWIGTSSGLAHFKNNKPYETFTKSNGLPDNYVTQVVRDHTGTVWLVAGAYLCRLESGKLTRLRPGADLPIASVRTIYDDPEHNLWIGGYGGVARLVHGVFAPVVGPDGSKGGPVVSLLKDHLGNLWMGSNRLRILSTDGRIKIYSAINGVHDRPIRSLREDRDGNVWLGTDDGLSRFRNGGFEAPAVSSADVHDRVRSMYEDAEGDLWVGMNTGLSRFRDDPFTLYSKTEGLPSDEPTTVHQDRAGKIWIGFQNAGLILLDERGLRAYNTSNGLPDDEIYSIRETAHSGLLVSSRGGLSYFRAGRFKTFVPSRNLNRQLVYDALEDRSGRIWIASDDGLSQLVAGRFLNIIPGGLELKDFMGVLCEGMGSILWAGSRGSGLWRLDNGQARHFTTADGLSSDLIRALTQSQDGTLWIGTFGGGLNRFRDDSFFHYTSKQGLPSDNIFYIEDDGRGSLWLSTTRGLSRVSKKDLEDLAAGKINSVSSVNYGTEDGLRSPQCASGSMSCKGVATTDGRLWLPTGHGVAVFDPKRQQRAQRAPQVHLVEMTAMGRPVDLNQQQALVPGTSDIQLRYAGIHLSAPEAVRYSYRLEGVDKQWVSAGGQRTITYTNLHFGKYRFIVNGQLKDGPASEASYEFRILPHFYETSIFQCFAVLMLLGATGLAYKLHLRRIRGRFALVLQERARIAREIHDTLAQGFVGISSQLDAVSMCLEGDPQAAQGYLDLARKMTRHSLSEARRSVAALRASALSGNDLATALKAEAVRWTAASNLQVRVDVCQQPARLPRDIEQNLLRIAQEAVTNTLKHASAAKLLVQLRVEAPNLYLLVADDGRGCSKPVMSSSLDGHFGLIGMRERAQSIGGQFRFQSEPGSGTFVEVTVPLT